VVLLALAMGQALVVLHGPAHSPSQAVADCGVCLLAAQPARVPDVLLDVLAQHAISIELGVTACAPYVRPIHGTRIARAPPLSKPTSEAS
jgi:hypothetical protein